MGESCPSKITLWLPTWYPAHRVVSAILAQSDLFQTLQPQQALQDMINVTQMVAMETDVLQLELKAVEIQQA